MPIRVRHRRTGRRGGCQRPLLTNLPMAPLLTTTPAKKWTTLGRNCLADRPSAPRPRCADLPQHCLGSPQGRGGGLRSSIWGIPMSASRVVRKFAPGCCRSTLKALFQSVFVAWKADGVVKTAGNRGFVRGRNRHEGRQARGLRSTALWTTPSIGILGLTIRSAPPVPHALEPYVLHKHPPARRRRH